MVTDEQVRLLRQKRMEGKSQEAAAAAAGMSVRTAQAWERGATLQGLLRLSDAIVRSRDSLSLSRGAPYPRIDSAHRGVA